MRGRSGSHARPPFWTWAEGTARDALPLPLPRGSDFCCALPFAHGFDSCCASSLGLSAHGSLDRWRIVSAVVAALAMGCEKNAVSPWGESGYHLC